MHQTQTKMSLNSRCAYLVIVLLLNTTSDAALNLQRIVPNPVYLGYRHASTFHNLCWQALQAKAEEIEKPDESNRTLFLTQQVKRKFDATDIASVLIGYTYTHQIIDDLHTKAERLYKNPLIQRTVYDRIEHDHGLAIISIIQDELNRIIAQDLITVCQNNDELLVEQQTKVSKFNT